MAVYFVLTGSISMLPILLSEALYRGAAIVPIKKRHDTKNDREDNDGRPTEDFNAGQGFFKFDWHSKTCKHASPEETGYLPNSP